MIMMVFVINQKKAANNNLFGNVKVIYKYNFRSSLKMAISNGCMTGLAGIKKRAFEHFPM